MESSGGIGKLLDSKLGVFYVSIFNIVLYNVIFACTLKAEFKALEVLGLLLSILAGGLYDWFAVNRKGWVDYESRIVNKILTFLSIVAVCRIFEGLALFFENQSVRMQMLAIAPFDVLFGQFVVQVLLTLILLMVRRFKLSGKAVRNDASKVHNNSTVYFEKLRSNHFSWGLKQDIILLFMFVVSVVCLLGYVDYFYFHKRFSMCSYQLSKRYSHWVSRGEMPPVGSLDKNLRDNLELLSEKYVISIKQEQRPGNGNSTTETSIIYKVKEGQFWFPVFRPRTIVNGPFWLDETSTGVKSILLN